MEVEVAQGKVTIVIGVPGMWADRAAIVRAVTEHNHGDVLMAGKILMHVSTGHGFEFDIYPRDPNMGKAFQAAGGHWITPSELKQIDAHRQTVYILGPGGNQENAREMMQMANALLKAGGIAVKVESAGKALPAGDWAQMCAGSGPLVLYDAYVIFGANRNVVNSCGMHNLGYHDAIIESDLPPGEAVTLLDAFLKYLLVEQPTIAEGQTFALAPDSPAYRLTLEPCTVYPAGDLFHNPFGVWRLTPLENTR